MVEIKVDNKGRILLPLNIRNRLNIKENDILQMNIKSKNIIIKKIDDPFKKLDDLIGDVKFDPKNRKKYEDFAIKMVSNNE